MKKIKFNISMRSQIESGEYQVVMRDNNKPVRIICWDADPEYPICYLEKSGNQTLSVMVGPNGNFYENLKDPADERISRADLFVLVPDDEKENRLVNSQTDLLTREISSRIHHGLKVYCQGFADPKIITGIKYDNGIPYVSLDGEYCYYSVYLIRPYLRPLSDMTDTELAELDEEIIKAGGIGYNHQYNDTTAIPWIDFMLKYHFDYRGLIDMGLAIKATSDVYNFK